MKTYPIAELFKAPQGEGTYSGTLMAFIRFAGCTVGKPYTQEERKVLNIIPVYQEKCVAFNGTEFACDTNYKMSEKKTVDEIIAFIGDLEHVCLTGGEPLMHDLNPLFEQLALNQKQVHIETSGTIFPEYLWPDHLHSDLNLWLTVAPKQGYLEDALSHADEIKLLIDGDTQEEDLRPFADYMDRVYLMSINNETMIIQSNIRRCLEWQQVFPEARIGIQLHKVIGTR